MAAREVVRLIAETTYGVYASGNAATAAIIHLRDGNQMTMRQKPVRWRERSAAGSNRPTIQGSKQKVLAGNLQTDMFPSQAAALINYLCGITLVGSGATAVWNLPSFSLEHKIIHDDMSSGSFKRYLGCKMAAGEITASSPASGTVSRLNLSIVGQKNDVTFDSTDWVEPTFATTPHYPTEDPFVFQDMAGNLILNIALDAEPVSRTGFRNMKFSVKNDLLASHDEGEFVRRIHWAGREATFEVDLAYVSDADRDAYEASTEFPVSFAFNDGVKTLTVDLQGQAFYETLEDDLPLAGDGFYQKLTVMPLLDKTIATPNDFTAILTTNP